MMTVSAAVKLMPRKSGVGQRKEGGTGGKGGKGKKSEQKHVFEPYLIQNGCPVILTQVENEYGSYGNDHV